VTLFVNSQQVEIYCDYMLVVVEQGEKFKLKFYVKRTGGGGKLVATKVCYSSEPRVFQRGHKFTEVLVSA